MDDTSVFLPASQQGLCKLFKLSTLSLQGVLSPTSCHPPQYMSFRPIPLSKCLAIPPVLQALS